MSNTVLNESAALAPAVAAEPKGIWRSKIIAADVQGSSGYYPGDVLRRDGSKAFPAGTHVYFDHPTDTEERERPERSVRDLAGYLTDDAAFEDGLDGSGLYARIQFLPHVKEHIRSIAEHVGLSIRAAGEIAETATGRVVKSIQHGLSVDVVTRAGAGGRLIYMAESDTQVTTQASAGSGGTTTQGADTGTLIQEIVAMKESQDRLTLAFTKLTQLLKDKQKEADRQLQEALSVGQVVAKLMEADLPNSSRARLAENYRPGQDLEDSIRKEREYLKSVMKESSRGNKDNAGGSGLGLTESNVISSTSTSDDFSAIEDVLSGRLF